MFRNDCYLAEQMTAGHNELGQMNMCENYLPVPEHIVLPPREIPFGATGETIMAPNKVREYLLRQYDSLESDKIELAEGLYIEREGSPFRFIEGFTKRSH